MDQVKAFAASNALHYVRQLISIVGNRLFSAVYVP
jgi:hypothetical protein